MAINRAIYVKSFSIENIPDWNCPSCKKGILKGIEQDFVIEESAISKNARHETDWEPDWINGSFIGKIICNNSECHESIFVLGRMSVKEEKKYSDLDGIWEYSTKEVLFPQLFKPALHIFEINNDIPDNIKAAIENAFLVFWIDNASCANKIRNVVELIMNEKKISKTYLDHNGSKKKYTLHKRIELFETRDPEASEFLMAIKWIGNSGSHANENIFRNDVLDGLDILQHVTHKLYEKETSRIKQLGKRINKKKGPIKKQ